jgi:hypothetical protein
MIGEGAGAALALAARCLARAAALRALEYAADQGNVSARGAIRGDAHPARVADRLDRLAGRFGGLPVLLDQRLPVQPERVGVCAQKALDERRAGQQIPLFILERAEILRPDLGCRLDLGYVDSRAHPRLAQRLADLGHAPEG